MSRVHDDSATWAVVTPVFEDGASFARLCRELSRLELGGGVWRSSPWTTVRPSIRPSPLPSRTPDSQAGFFA